MKPFARWLPIVVLTAACYAQTPKTPSPLPADLPSAGPLKTVVSPAVDQHKLANGMSVWLVQRKALPKVVFTLLVRGGDSLDPASSPGLAQLMAKAMAQGTTSKSSRTIAETAQGAGGDLSTEVDADSVQVTLDCLTEHAGDAVALVADVARNATFPEKEVALAKSNMEDELRSNEAEPRFLARRAWYQVVYGDHPYHIVAPSMKTLESATPDSLRALYAQSFRPDQALLVVVGSFDPAQVSKDVEKAFGEWKASKPVEPTVKEPTGDRKSVV